MQINFKVCVKLTGTLLAAFAMLATTTFSQAQTRKCGKRASLIKVLIEKYKETPRALGLSSANKIAMEIYASEKGSWTVMMTMTNGMTCIMAAGHSWQEGPKIDKSPRT